MRLKIKNNTRGLSFLFFGLSTAALIISQIYPQNFFTVDFSSYLVQVDALRNFGQSYSLFWDIKPPGLQIILLLWSIPFGTSFLSYFILNASLLAVALVATFWIIHKFVPQKFQTSACAFVLVTQGVFADYGRNFLSADFIGVTIVISSTALLMANRSTSYNTFALFGLLYAGSVKEVFILSPLLYLCLVTRNNWKAILRNFTITSFLFVAVIVSYLLFTGELGEYVKVLNFKRIVFAVEPVQFFKITAVSLFYLVIQETLILVILLFATLAFVRLTQMGQSLTLLGMAFKIILCINILLFSGLVLQQKSFSGHYLLAVFLPATIGFLITIGKFLMHFSYKLWLFNLTLAAVLILGFLSNSPNYQRIVSPNKTIEWFQSFEVSSDIAEYKVAGEGCMQVAYGWGSGSYYHYSDRLPCSKYFISNLLLASQDQKKSFVNDLLNYPPADVVYDTRWADLDTREFELGVFPWSRVLESCYVRVDTSKFHSKFSRIGPLKRCLAETVEKTFLD